MITYDPSGYADRDLRDDKFYKDIVSWMGIPARSTVISPICQQFDYSATAPDDMLFDVGNPGLGNIPFGSQTGRSIYHGNLTITIYCSAFPTTASTAISFLVCPSAYPVPTELSYLYDQRTEAGIAATINSGNRYEFNSVIFKYLRLVLSGGDSTYRCEGIFTGMKITY